MKVKVLIIKADGSRRVEVLDIPDECFKTEAK